jgi:hypothetical protein
MSWRDVIEMPASTFMEYLEEIKEYSKKVKNGK